MAKLDHVLSFATDKNCEQLFIHADGKGLDILIRSLQNIRAKLGQDVCEHDHLMTDEWGGTELSERTLPDAIHTIHHVKIYGWTPEWKRKHGLSD
jgi:hypothetical protein